MRDEVKDPARTASVVAQSLRAIYGLVNVRNLSASPEANLVPEDPKSACQATANGTFRDDSPRLAAQVQRWRLLDHERSLRNLDPERGVIEVARRPPLQACGQRLIDATVEPDEVPTGAAGQPVQVDCRALDLSRR
ncbi:MAG: hypothetical protein ABWY95_08140 [Thermoleophilaceae bacterium]